jgi:hypothetical protein
MNTKIIFIITLLTNIIAFPLWGRNNESLKSISDRIVSEELNQIKLFNNLYKQKKLIEEKLTFFNNYRINQKGLYGLGEIEKLEVIAERYEHEKKAREIIKVELTKLFSMMDQLEKLQEKTMIDKKMLKLKSQILELSNVDGQNLILPATEEDIMYFEVKTAGTFKDIAALPEVYGDSDSWRYLFEANKDQFKDPQVIVPKGTELIVPNIRVVSPIDISGGQE